MKNIVNLHWYYALLNTKTFTVKKRKKKKLKPILQQTINDRLQTD